ncbi:MAG: universal stress protein [Methanoregula sp.]|nr:universal stress protein [Methanoregula sp.]
MTPKKRLNILFADDGSQHAQAAVELLRDIPLPENSRISVLHAFNSGEVPHVTEYERSLERTREQLTKKHFRVETELKLGSAAEMILERSQERKPDLIVLGAKGLRGTAGILLGGVAQQVIEYAHCPVLIVRAPYRGLHHILLVTDGSVYSRNAARYLAEFPLPSTQDIRLMHVLPPMRRPIMMEPYYGGWQTIYAQFPTREEELAIEKKDSQLGEGLLKRTSNLLQRRGIKPTTVLTRGDAATEIIDYASLHHLDLIVAGSRGLSEFKGWWMGSVSRKLVHYSKSSVLIVKGPEKE